MTQFWKHQNLRPQDSHGIVGAYLSTPPTCRAGHRVDLGNQDSDLPNALEVRAQEKMRVWGLYITIQE